MFDELPTVPSRKVRSLRTSKRLTIDELSERLGLPRTTIYYWVRDLPLTRDGRPSGWPAGAQRLGTLAMQRKYRVIREKAYAEGLRSFDDLALDHTFRDFVCLYMAEGSKRSRNVVAICNSDPAIIRVANRWMRTLARNPVRYSIQYHADQRLAELTRFWGAELAVDPTAIRMQRKSNSNQLSGRNWRSRWGVLTIWAGDTVFRAQLEAWMHRVRGSWD